MKYYSILAAAALSILLASCSKHGDRTPCMVPVNVCVTGFNVSQEDFPSKAAQTVADYTDVKAITLAFYASDGTEVLKTTQLRGDASNYTTFGNFSCALPIGTFTMVVIGRGHFDGDVLTLTSPTEAAYTSERVRETFSTTQEVSVNSTNPINLSVTLNRIIAKLNIVSTDGRSAGITRIRTTYSAGGKNFNPTTGLATSNSGYSLTNNPSTATGSPIGITSFIFLASDEQTIDVTIEAMDASNNVLLSKVVEGVSFKRNRVTTLSGPVFTAPTGAATFQLETGWLDPITVDFN